MPLTIISHTDCGLHEMGDFHPESPKRLTAIQDALIASGLEFAIKQIDAQSIDPELLSLAHDQAYIDRVFAASPTTGYCRLDPDTQMNSHTLTAALLAAGAGVQAADMVMAGDAGQVFCAVRPPGHHAESDKAMGFCFFNNIAITARYLNRVHGINRIAIVDFDVHHGNGTEQILAGDNHFLFCSTFQHPFYPYGSAENSAENIVNAPLAAGTGGAEFAEAVEQHWLPALASFHPQIILVSAGFDAHVEDEMSQLCFTEADYSWVTTKIREIANHSANGKIISMLEGGYCLPALGRSVVAHIKALLA